MLIRSGQRNSELSGNQNQGLPLHSPNATEHTRISLGPPESQNVPTPSPCTSVLQLPPVSTRPRAHPAASAWVSPFSAIQENSVKTQFKHPLGRGASRKKPSQCLVTARPASASFPGLPHLQSLEKPNARTRGAAQCRPSTGRSQESPSLATSPQSPVPLRLSPFILMSQLFSPNLRESCTRTAMACSGELSLGPSRVGVLPLSKPQFSSYIMRVNPLSMVIPRVRGDTVCSGLSEHEAG